MFPFIRCYCGRPIGHLTDAFNEMRRDTYIEYYNKNHPGVTFDMLAFNSIQLDISHVFKQLNLHTECCRVRIMSQVEYKEHY